MRHPQHSSILIVDGSMLSAFDLRAHLVNQGCRVHVVSSYDTALMVAHRKHVDTVFLEYSESAATRGFCASLAELNIPHIFTATHVDGESPVRLARRDQPAELRVF